MKIRFQPASLREQNRINRKRKTGQAIITIILACAFSAIILTVACSSIPYNKPAIKTIKPINQPIHFSQQPAKLALSTKQNQPATGQIWPVLDLKF